MGPTNAARELERFSAPFPGVLPDLFVAGDDAHEIHSPAPGVATGCRVRARGGRVGSGSRQAGRLRVEIAVSAPWSGRGSGSRQHRHSDCVTPARSQDGRGDREVGSRQRIRIRPRPIYHVLRRGAEGARCRELEGDRSGEVRAAQRYRSRLFRQPVLCLSRRPDRGRDAPGDRRGDVRGRCCRARASHAQPT